MKESAQKTSQLFQGQSVYQAKGPVGDYIAKGHKYYLDGLHKDHIKVFDSKGKVKAVLNIDGSFNDAKTKAARAEVTKMIDISMLDKFKDAYLELLKQKAGKVLDTDDLYLAEDYSIVESIQIDIKKLNLTIELFFNAKKNNDELAMQAALLRISTFLSGLYSIFDQTKADIDRFTLLPDTVDFPDDYKIPEHYHYPIK